MQIERIEQQIETYTSTLSHAVQNGQGAQFSMLLSMISASEDQAAKKVGSGGVFELPASEELSYPDPDSLYNEEIVGRLNTSVGSSNFADMAYVLSHVHAQAIMPENQALAADTYARIGLTSSRNLIISEIEESRSQFSAVA